LRCGKISDKGVHHIADTLVWKAKKLQNLGLAFAKYSFLLDQSCWLIVVSCEQLTDEAVKYLVRHISQSLSTLVELTLNFSGYFSRSTLN